MEFIWWIESVGFYIYVFPYIGGIAAIIHIFVNFTILFIATKIVEKIGARFKKWQQEKEKEKENYESIETEHLLSVNKDQSNIL